MLHVASAAADVDSAGVASLGVFAVLWLVVAAGIVVVVAVDVMALYVKAVVAVKAAVAVYAVAAAKHELAAVAVKSFADVASGAISAAPYLESVAGYAHCSCLEVVFAATVPSNIELVVAAVIDKAADPEGVEDVAMMVAMTVEANCPVSESRHLH